MVNNFDKGAKAIHWEKDVHFNTVLEQLHMCMFPLTPKKSLDPNLAPNTNLKQIRYLNMRVL